MQNGRKTARIVGILILVSYASLIIGVAIVGFSASAVDSDPVEPSLV